MKKTGDIMATEYAETVIVGHGGGFTGAVTQYIIATDGQITKTYGMPSKDADTISLSRVSEEQLKQIHEGLDSLQLKGISFNYPGNMNWFITIEQGDSIKNTILWGEPNDHKIDAAIKTYHNTVLEWVQQIENDKQ
ncbi:MAG: hypothetical protein R3E32_16255 [Chitinophagales bacterium]